MTQRSRALLFAFAAVAASAAGAGRAHAGTLPGSRAEQGSAFAAGDTLPAAFGAQLPQRRSLSLAEAITIATSRHPGRVVRAQTIEQGNGAVHEIRIIGNDGRVHTVRVDARTGAVQ